MTDTRTLVAHIAWRRAGRPGFWAWHWLLVNMPEGTWPVWEPEEVTA